MAGDILPEKIVTYFVKVTNTDNRGAPNKCTKETEPHYWLIQVNKNDEYDVLIPFLGEGAKHLHPKFYSLIRCTIILPCLILIVITTIYEIGCVIYIHTYIYDVPSLTIGYDNSAS